MKKIFAIILLAATFALGAVAAPLTADRQQQVIASINKAAASVRTMQGGFTQTKHLAMLSNKLVSEGKIAYTKPNLLRWEYTSPYQYLFIFNGAKVYVGNSTRKDVIDTASNKIFKEIGRLMMSTVTGTVLSSPTDFAVEVADGGTTLWQVTLVPKKRDMKKMFSRIVLMFRKSDYMISQITIHEKNNDSTDIRLKNLTVNGTVNETLFAIP